MFGNRIGYGASVVILILAYLFLMLIERVGTTMSPGTAVADNADKYTMKLPVDPRKIAEDKDVGWMKEVGDSTPLYKELDVFMVKESKAFDAFSKKPVLENNYIDTIEEGADLLIKAGKLKGGGVFKDNLAEIILYDTENPRLRRIDKTLKDTYFTLACLYKTKADDAEKAKETEKAEKARSRAREIFQGLFSLGVKLYEERFVFEEWNSARNLLIMGLYLGKMVETTSPAAAVQFKACEDQIVPFFLSNIEAPRTATTFFFPRPADMVALAKNGGDPMWRVEGTLKLGRIKYSSNIQVSQQKMIAITRPDILATLREIQKLMNDPDPRVRRAAQLAHELDEPTYRKMTGSTSE